MRLSGPPGADLVPLDERMRMISAVRALVVAIVLISWQLIPASRGVAFETSAVVGITYLVTTLAVEWGWRKSGTRATMLFGIFAFTDALFIAWASYGVGGIDSPLVHLVVVHLITVSLLASFRTGLKLALLSACLLISAVHLQETGALNALGGQQVTFLDATYGAAAIQIAVFFIVAIATTSFAATNERELRRRRYDLEALAQFALQLEHHEDPAGVADCLLDAVADTYGCQPSLVVRCDDDELELLATRAADGASDRPGTRLGPMGTQSLRAVIEGGTTRLISRRSTPGDPIFDHFSPRANVAIVPLRDHQGEAAGALLAEYPALRGSRIERRAVSMLERLAAHASLALENAYLLERIRLMATRDPLTGLPNRRELDRMLDAACARVQRGQGVLGVMMVDIDHFKKLNDTFGHQAGDDALKEVAKALAADLRAGDLAARYGGEEFSLVMPGSDMYGASVAAERVRARVEALQLPDGIKVTCSIGVAIAPAHGTTSSVLLEAADEALYAAKQGGRNRVVVAGHDAQEHAPAA